MAVREIQLATVLRILPAIRTDVAPQRLLDRLRIEVYLKDQVGGEKLPIG